MFGFNYSFINIFIHNSSFLNLRNTICRIAVFDAGHYPKLDHQLTG